jgi:hypothetical protein
LALTTAVDIAKLICQAQRAATEQTYNNFHVFNMMILNMLKI